MNAAHNCRDERKAHSCNSYVQGEKCSLTSKRRSEWLRSHPSLRKLVLSIDDWRYGSIETLRFKRLADLLKGVLYRGHKGGWQRKYYLPHVGEFWSRAIADNYQLVEVVTVHTINTIIFDREKETKIHIHVRASLHCSVSNRRRCQWFVAIRTSSCKSQTFSSFLQLHLMRCVRSFEGVDFLTSRHPCNRNRVARFVFRSMQRSESTWWIRRKSWYIQSLFGISEVQGQISVS